MNVLTEQQKRILVYLSIGIVITILLYLFISANSEKIIRHSPFALPQKTPYGINILIVGVDNDVDELHRRRSDTIMLANINPQKHKISLISIPRDTRIPVPGYGLNKANHAYYYGGIHLLVKTIEGFLHVNIPYYLIIDNAGVRNIIDSVGGITVDVEERMQYVDRSGGLYIDLYPGRQKMDGAHAEQYIRFRRDTKADIGRVARQQKVIKAISGKLKGPTLILSGPRLILTMMRFTESNIPWRYYLGIATQFKTAYENNKIDSRTIPSEAVWIDEVSFQQPNMAEAENIVQTEVYGLKKISVKKGPPLKKPQMLSVEILIGNGSAASLTKVYSRIAQNGYKISGTRYAGRQDYTQTMLVNWHGAQTKREALVCAAALGIPKANIIHYALPKKPITFSVVIGNDRK